MIINKYIFLKFLQSIDCEIIDCEIIEVWPEPNSRRDIIFNSKKEDGHMLGQFCIKIDKYLEFIRDYKIKNLTK